jgi:hypothetical protein
MSVVVRRAFALLLLGGAVGASLALPAIFDDSQLANRGPLPTGTNPTTTQVRVSFPPVVKAHRTFNAPSRPVVTTRPAAPHVAPVARPRAQAAPTLPVAAATPVSPPATPAPNPAPAPAPATTTAAPVLAAVSSDNVPTSAPVPTVPAVTDTASTQTREKHGAQTWVESGNKRGQGQGGDQGGDQGKGGHGQGGNGNGHGDNGHGKNGNGNGKGH